MGASLLAMDVNDNAGFQSPRGALKFIASRLAPTPERPVRVFIVSAQRVIPPLELPACGA
ncbi:hypothetical protein PspS04_07095 [Pseudomonas sp. S04]|nr:hypothetical protein PspS04_07095 [Pseudomonas sp. S04]QHF32633.1 hypothetical protein PspS19_07095 [Pseudomonas sp. S19]